MQPTEKYIEPKMEEDPNQPRERLRVMTFNIRGSFRRQDGMNVWPNRRDCNISMIERLDPDIIGFQEVQAGNFQDYENCIGRDYDFVVGHVCKRSMEWSMGDLYDRWKDSSSPVSAFLSAYDYVVSNVGSSSQQDEHCPIYFKRSKFDLVTSGSFYLSETPEVESISWESKLLRAATWVRLRARKTKAEFLVTNTHFPHERDDMTRAECATVILQQLATLAPEHVPQIVLGDFNCHASLNTPAYASFFHNGFQDTFVDGSDDSAGAIINTFHHFLGDDCPWT